MKRIVSPARLYRCSSHVRALALEASARPGATRYERYS